MLTAAPASVSERFGEALRPGVMGPRLAAAQGGMPGACHVLDAKFEPGVRAVLLYEQGGRLLRGDLVPDGGLASADPARMVEPGVLVSPFPHDPELPSLPSVMDPACLGRALARALPEAGVGPRARVPRSRMRLLRYRPGKRVTLLVAQGPQSPAYVAKAYHSAAKAAAVVEEAPMLQNATSPAGTLSFAPLVGFVPDLALVVQQRVAGTPLDLLLRSPDSSPPGLRQGLQRAGRALAQLHATAVPSRRQRSVEAELVRFGERASRISTVDPVLGHAAADLAERLMTTLDQLPPAHTGVVHGDCKPSQFLITERGVVLLDLDHVGISDQAADVGTFLASLRQQDVRHALAGRSGRPSASSASLAELFLAGYLAGGGTCREPSRTRWQEAVALERKALRAFARAPRSPVPRALIVEAHACLDRAEEAS
jgi:Phosphotransferase enzyme family